MTTTDIMHRVANLWNVLIWLVNDLACCCRLRSTATGPSRQGPERMQNEGIFGQVEHLIIARQSRVMSLEKWVLRMTLTEHQEDLRETNAILEVWRSHSSIRHATVFPLTI
jgi:hypothetical protein